MEWHLTPVFMVTSLITSKLDMILSFLNIRVSYSTKYLFIFFTHFFFLWAFLIYLGD